MTRKNQSKGNLSSGNRNQPEKKNVSGAKRPGSTGTKGSENKQAVKRTAPRKTAAINRKKSAPASGRKGSTVAKSSRSIPRKKANALATRVKGLSPMHWVCVFLVVMILIASGILIAVKSRRNILPSVPESYAQMVLKSSEEFNVPPEIILAIIKTESDFKSNESSPVGACGLMQIMPGGTLQDINKMLKESYTKQDLFDPAINIRCGTCYLAYLYRYFKDYDLVFAAYNGGMGNVEKWLKDSNYSKDGKLIDIPFPETKRYVEKVHKNLKEFEHYFDAP